jgi:hypothetical protein
MIPPKDLPGILLFRERLWQQLNDAASIATAWPHPIVEYQPQHDAVVF